ncbi:hypothetical protein GJ689_22905 [Rhodoplanes serenus]|uniref:CRISPR type III-associated protein domain-containing protein n=1 Tax=Rhodoplanes serenus TaxID=200615 RepID=A0A9X5AU44_9BRAD|nr:RAMP superfamily CRISPR-associated protein [Rhodoplanes serenus]MTW19051.1 hypothetical protein [Rhodoplanes serenus]
MREGASPRILHDITATLVVLSPLHVGSGDTCNISTVTGKKGANRQPEVAAIVRDVDDAPYLPGTTIKGLLRRLAEERDGREGAAVERLFGSIKSSIEAGGGGAAGRVTVFGARRIAAPAVPEAPFVNGAADELGRGVFVAARTRIDPSSGTAGDHTLFHQEMVVPETTFALRLRIDMRGRIGGAGGDHVEQTEAAARDGRDARCEAKKTLDELVALLDLLCEESGWPIGKGQSDGFGRVRLDPASVEIQERVLGADGTFTSRTTKRPLARSTSAAAAADVLRLVCDGPFLVVDASKTRKQGGSDEGKEPQIAAQVLAKDEPLLLGTSVAGVLRARARWLEMRARLRGLRDGAAEKVDPERVVWRKGDDPGRLSSVQRLFGITGLRGRLEIVRAEVRGGTPWDVTSVKLDRFTGGPVDNALFKTRTFIGVRLALVLRLGPGRLAGLDADRGAQDEALYHDLLDDIRKNGLTLGHGGNKGFGWFRSEGAS